MLANACLVVPDAAGLGPCGGRGRDSRSQRTSLSNWPACGFFGERGFFLGGSMDLDRLRELEGEGLSQREIAERVGASQASVSRALRAIHESGRESAVDSSAGESRPDVPDLTPPRERSGPGWKRWVDEVRTPWLQKVGARDAAVTKRSRF
jgi:biotin operon repressor